MSCVIKTEHLRSDILRIVEKLAEKEGIVKPVLSVYLNDNDEGALGTVYYVSVTDIGNTKSLDLVVKNAPADPLNMVQDIINKTYYNEKFFYKDLWPVFQLLQQKCIGRLLFDVIAKCYFAVVNNTESHKIVLENLTVKGFHTVNKRGFFDKIHMELVLKEYGKFHALSFVLKSKFPDKFFEFSRKLSNVFYEMKEITLFVESMKLIFKQCLDFFSDDPDEKLIKRLRYYSNSGASMYFECLESKDENMVFNHGDCWSNNIMFKYNSNGEPSDLRFIDFQQMSLTSPVFDLSYSIYSNGSSAVLEDLDHYLGVYHQSLSDMLKQFGLDIQVIYPFGILKSSWKKYSKFGYSMSLLVLKQKLKYKHVEGIDLTDKIEDNIHLESLEEGKYDKKLFEERARYLVRHMFTNDFF